MSHFKGKEYTKVAMSLSMLIEQTKAILVLYRDANFAFTKTMYDEGFEAEFYPDGCMDQYGKRFTETLTGLENELDRLSKAQSTLHEKGLLQYTMERMN